MLCLRSCREWQTVQTTGRGMCSSNTSRVQDPAAHQGSGVGGFDEAHKTPRRKGPWRQGLRGAPESVARRLRSRVYTGVPPAQPPLGGKENQEGSFQHWDLLQNLIPTTGGVAGTSGGVQTPSHSSKKSGSLSELHHLLPSRTWANYLISLSLRKFSGWLNKTVYHINK